MRDAARLLLPPVQDGGSDKDDPFCRCEGKCCGWNPAVQQETGCPAGSGGVRDGCHNSPRPLFDYANGLVKSEETSG